MDKLRTFLDLPELKIKDAQELYNISHFIKNKNARSALGHNKILLCFSNENVRKKSILELIDACNIIENSILKDIFEQSNDKSNSKIIATNCRECFICNGHMKFHSAAQARLYDDYSGRKYIFHFLKRKEKFSSAFIT